MNYYKHAQIWWGVTKYLHVSLCLLFLQKQVNILLCYRQILVHSFAYFTQKFPILLKSVQNELLLHFELACVKNHLSKHVMNFALLFHSLNDARNVLKGHLDAQTCRIHLFNEFLGVTIQFFSLILADVVILSLHRVQLALQNFDALLVVPNFGLI